MTFFSRFFSFLLVFALDLSACSSKPKNLSEEALVGYAHFKGFGCAICHRVGGEGGVIGPDLTFIGFRKSPEWLDLWLKNPSHWKHNTLMPNFFLKDNVRKALVAYLASLKGEAYLAGSKPWDSPELKEDPVKRGEAIFSHAGCAGCHGAGGKGGYPNNNVVGGLIPSLINVSDGYSKEELAEKIRKGVPQSASEDPNSPAPMIHMPAWSQVMKDDEIESLVEYLYSLKPKGSGESWD